MQQDFLTPKTSQISTEINIHISSIIYTHIHKYIKTSVSRSPIQYKRRRMADIIKSLIAEKPVVIFSKTSESMCFSVKALIKNYGANATVYELDEISIGVHIERELLRLGCSPCVPAVFIGQKFIGGADKIFNLQLKNELVHLLIQAKAIWI